jgi:hypothetical protein
MEAAKSHGVTLLLKGDKCTYRLCKFFSFSLMISFRAVTVTEKCKQFTVSLRFNTPCTQPITSVWIFCTPCLSCINEQFKMKLCALLPVTTFLDRTN